MNGKPTQGSSLPSPDPYKWRAAMFAAITLTTLPVTLGVVFALQPPPPVDPLDLEANRLGVERYALLAGREMFTTSCATCHGVDGQGVPRLGKPLRNSAFVQSSTDEELLTLIRGGRPPSDPANTTGMLMPPRGANPTLTDARLSRIVAYLRMMQEPGAPLASVEAWVRPAPVAAPAGALASAAGAGTAGAAALADAAGHAVFIASCSACHGEQGQGLEGLGKPLAGSVFVQSKTDPELMAFVKQGRPMWDPENTTGVDMPPKGGNPALSDADLEQIVQFIRAIQPGAGSPSATPDVSAAGAGGALADAIGHASFVASCSACHGEQGQGLEGLGKPLAGSVFVQSKTDPELMAFVKQGRPMWDPENTTGVDMPPKGGNPALGDEELGQIISFIRSLQEGAGAPGDV